MMALIIFGVSILLGLMAYKFFISRRCRGGGGFRASADNASRQQKNL
jgi:hypothetical protein